MGVWYGSANSDFSRSDSDSSDGLRRSDLTGGVYQDADGRDHIEGYGGADVLEGYGGSDWIYGGEQADDIYGNNQIYPYGGNSPRPGWENFTASNDAGDYLYGDDGNDRLFGQQGGDSLYGGDDDDQLFGGDGDDFLEGWVGSNIIDGGSGVDVVSYEASFYYVNVNLATGETFSGEPNYLHDLLIGIENVRGSRNGDFITGNDGSNLIYGFNGDDYINGGVGYDSLFGGAGDDRILPGADADIVDGGSGKDTISYINSADGVTVDLEQGVGDDDLIENIENAEGSEYGDYLYGNELNNQIFGRDGFDIIDGRAGADYMDGGAETDWYYVDDVNDRVIDAIGMGEYDRVMAVVSYTLEAGQEIEFLEASGLSSGPLKLVGNEFDQRIDGNSADNLIDGKGGADLMVGGAGNDQYFIDNLADEIIDTSGVDMAASKVTYVLTADVEVETLRTTANAGTSAINLTGNKFAQTIIGNAGTNVLHDGGAGAADTMQGLGGNDTYRVFNAGDVIVESSSQGAADVVMAAVDYVLTTGAYIERLATNGTAGTSGIDLTGNDLAQEIIGNAGANILKGLGGRDHIRGQDGNDTLIGGAGRDFFGFNTPLNAAKNVDKITDFSVVDDTIELYKSTFAALITPGALAASAFRANTTGLAGDADDRIIYETDTGKLFYDGDGNAGGAGVHFATLTGMPTVTASDFVVI